MIDNLPLGHLKISQGDLESFISYVQHCIENGKKSYCIPIHITKYEMSKKDLKLKEVINNAGIVIADGIPINWLSRRMGYKNVCRVTGIEFGEAILSLSDEKKWRIYLLGARQENLEKAVKNIKKKFRDPFVIGAHDGYFSSEQLEKIIKEINSLKPDILFLGLGMPQKEYFIHDHFNKITATFWLPVGGGFDIWADTKKRSPLVIQKLGLEWVQRSFYNKKKAQSVFKYGLPFLKDLILNKK